MPYDLEPVTPPVSRVDLAISAWNHAKKQLSQSSETSRSYETTLCRFRSSLLKRGIDLDAMDPQYLRQILDSEETFPIAERVTRVEQLVEAHMTIIALAAQVFAARPTSDSRPPSANTANLRLAIISSFYAYVLRQGIFHGTNPITRVERRKVTSYTTAQGIDHDTLLTSLNAIDRSTRAGSRDYALLLIGLYTGRRLSELAAMSYEHVVVRKTTVDILWPHCKGGKTMRDTFARRGLQALPIHALLTWLATLQEQNQEQQALMISRTEQPIWISVATNGTAGHRLSLQGIADICEARIGTSKVHALRHTFARALEDAGAKVSEIQARLGHASLETTSRYLAQLRHDENPHLAHLTQLYGLQTHLPADAAVKGDEMLDQGNML